MRRTLPLAILLLATCTTTRQADNVTTTPKAMIGAHGFELAGMDTTAKPCDDFYRFAVGKWRQNNPLKPEYSRFGRFEEVAERNRGVLRQILEEDAAMSATAPGSAQQKLGDYYAACMNESAIDLAGLTPIQPELDRISAITDRSGLMTELGRLHALGYAPLFRLGNENDYHNSKMVIASLNAGSIGLPDRDYYIRSDERFSKIRTQYVEHVSKMLTLTGQDPSQAERIVALEAKLAQAMMARVELRNPENRYHITTVADLTTMAPGVDWHAYLRGLGVDQTSVNVTQPNYIKAVDQLLSDVPLEDWKAYLRWDVLNTNAPSLSRAIADEDFAFNSGVLSGTQKQEERWKRCVRSADANVGQLLGEEYVRRNFTPEAKAKMGQLIDNLVAALREDIPTLQWMGPATKQAALEKLNAFARHIGYPEKWRDYSALDITRSSYAQDVQAARQFAFRRGVQRIGKPDDPAEWSFFTPSTVNASYNSTRNDITFPAGILQPPFYDPNADDAYNYGGIGVVIGHEMTHGFDDQGAKFDPQGNLRNWWTDQDLANFQTRTSCIANEYSEFNVAPGVNINGKLVNGEAVADLGGATIALRAYEKSLQGKSRAKLDGFTPEQRFFLGFAQVWGENMALQEQTRRALVDPHAQGPFRVNGTVANMPEFQKAWGCAESAPMVREAAKRCSIW